VGRRGEEENGWERDGTKDEDQRGMRNVPGGIFATTFRRCMAEMNSEGCDQWRGSIDRTGTVRLIL